MKLIQHTIKLACLLFITLINSYLNAQIKDNDSYNLKKADFFASRNLDSLLYFSKILQESENNCTKLNGYYKETHYYYRKGDYELAQKRSYDLIDQLENLEDECNKIIHISALNRLYWIYKNQNKINLAFETLIKQENIINKLQDKISARRYLNSHRLNLAYIKSDLGLHQEAISIYKSALIELNSIIPQLEGHPLSISISSKANIYNLIGQSFLELTTSKNDKLLDSSAYYFLRGYQTIQTIKPPHVESETLYNLRLAEIDIKKELYDQALIRINLYSKKQETYNTVQDINFLKSVIYCNQNIGDSLFYYSNRFLNYKTQTPSNEKNRIVILNLLAAYYKSTKKNDSAFKYSDLALSELNNLNLNKEKANKNHYLYDLKKVNLLNSQILDKQKQKHLYNELLIGLLSLMFGTVFVIGYQRTQKEKVNLLLTKQQTKAYTINKDVETLILEGLTAMENSKDFLKSNFSISTLANKLKTNTAYLSAVINEKKGMSFKNYVAQLRISYLINELIKNPKFQNYTIKALAEEIGYTNASAFTRAFKNQTGKTPTEYFKEQNN